MVVPKNIKEKAVIMEFKLVDRYENEDLEAAVANALKQIEDKKYETILLAKGIKNIIKLGIAFKENKFY